VAPAGSHFLWLSAPKPIVAPGTPFSPDLQSWMRDDPPLAPDWLRIGQDIIGNNPPPPGAFPTFNAAFSLSGQTFEPQITSLSQSSAKEGAAGFTLTVNGSNFTSASTVLFNGVPLATTFVSATQLQAAVTAALLADEGSANVGVFDAQRGLSNVQAFTITDNVPTVSATARLNGSLRKATVNGLFTDTALEGHRVRINWGDGVIDTLDLGTGRTGTFSKRHRYRTPLHRRTIIVTVLDDEGTASASLTLRVRR
jgi:hypothetical protein